MSPPPEQPALVPPHLIERCLALLHARPAGVVSDIDGTLSDIAATPETATVSDDIRRSLARLARRLDLVGIVTGRAAPIAATMIGLPELTYIGNHGMEQLRGEEIWQNPAAATATSAIAGAVAEIEAAFAAPYSDWLLVENKGVSASVHYRLAPDPIAAQAMLLPAISAAAERHGLVVTEGRLIFEFRPNVAINKGTALADLVARHKLRRLLFLGDDLTDVDAFLALQTLRDAGTIDGLAVGVLGPESHPRVRETMDIGIPGVPAAAALLEALSEQLDGPPPEPDGSGPT
jgi:trehalose 6-phosphate phosphatase